MLRLSLQNSMMARNGSGQDKSSTLERKSMASASIITTTRPTVCGTVCFVTRRVMTLSSKKRTMKTQSSELMKMVILLLMKKVVKSNSAAYYSKTTMARRLWSKTKTSHSATSTSSTRWIRYLSARLRSLMRCASVTWWHRRWRPLPRYCFSLTQKWHTALTRKMMSGASQTSPILRSCQNRKSLTTLTPKYSRRLSRPRHSRSKVVRRPSCAKSTRIWSNMWGLRLTRRARRSYHHSMMCK